MKFKKVINKVLFDPKHILGWALTTGALVGLFYLLGISEAYTPLYRVGFITGVIIAIDLFKHATELQ